MSFFDNLKNKMGIGGVSVELHAPDHVKKADNFVSGMFVITAKSDQYVKGISVRLIERRTTDNGKQRKSRTKIRGEQKISESFAITPRDIKEFNFELPFRAGAEWRDLKGGEVELGGVKTDLLKSVGSLAAIVSSETIDHYISVVTDVEGAWRNPSTKQRITLLR